MTGTETRVLQQALERIRELKQEIGELRRGSSEAVAIVGIGVEMAGGVTDPRQLWTALLDRQVRTAPVPDGRWPRGATNDPALYTTTGAYLDDSAFDPALFNISPRESAGLDPQQKAVLKTTWWALEDAGLTGSDIASSRTGVYVGVGSDDFTRAATRTLDEIDSHKALGGARSLAAGRLAYFLDAKGPVASIDTACSSSLVGVHLGVQSLRAGESDRIVVAGVNLMLHPSTTMGFCRLGALSPTGRCRAFDAAADGYVRGEGAVSLVLERESDARAAGRRILALIQGSAIGHDGRSNGLTAPNGTSQEGVIRAALGNAGVDPASVGYVEAHATGTVLGDPIELSALARVFGGDSDRPLWVGSLKANFGHLEAGAGLASLVKTVQILRHRTIPPQPNLDTPNPRFAWERHRLRVATSPVEMPPAAALAGVSAFGMSGTNAHVVIGAAPDPSPSEAPPATAGTTTPIVMTFAAPTGTALRAQTDQAQAELDRSAIPLDVLAGSVRDKDPQPYRMAAVGRSATDLTRAIERAVARVTATNGRPRLGLAFGGQGVFRPGVGEQLSKAFPDFRDSIEESAEVFHKVTGESLTQTLLTGETSPHLHQAATTALHLALGRVLTTAGVEPDFCVGHSLGEYAAAVHAGVMTAQTAMRLVSHRAALCARADWSTTMVRVTGEPGSIDHFLSVSKAATALVNGGRDVVVAVPTPQRDALRDPAEATAVTVEDVPIAAPYHTDAMAEVAHAFRPIVESESLRRPTSEILPGLAGRTGADMAHPDYWVDHLVEPFRFDQCLSQIRERHVDVLLELGAAPVVAPLALRDRAVAPASVVPSLRAGRAELDSFLDAAATLYSRGAGIRWRALLPTTGPVPAALRYRFSQEPLIPPLAAVDGSAPTGPEPVPIRLDRSHPVVADHVIAGRTVIAASYQLRMYRELATRLGINGSCAITDVEFREPLEVTEEGDEVALRAVPEQNRWSAALTSADGTTIYSRCYLEPVGHPPSPVPPPETGRVEEIATDDFYRTLRAAGYELGDSYARLRSLRVIDDHRATGAVADTDSPYTGLQPGTLDSCLQVLAAPLMARGERRDMALVPFHLERVEMAGTDELRDRPYTSSVEVVDVGEHVLLGGLTITAAGQDRPAVVVRGLRARVFHEHDRPAADGTVWDLRTTWCPAGQVTATTAARVVAMGDPDDLTGERIGWHAIPWPQPSDGAVADDLRAPAEAMATEVLAQLGTQPDPTTVVVIPPTGPGAGQRGLAMVWALLRTLAALEESNATGRVRWVVLTVGPRPRGPYPPCPSGAAAWATFRSVALELPGLDWHLAHAGSAEVDEIRRAVGIDLTTFVVDGPDVLVPHLAWERASLPEPAPGPAAVVGARGSLGSSVVEHLVDQGRDDTIAVLRGRAEEYEERHAGRVRAIALPEDPRQWPAAMTRIVARHPARPGVLHLAGTAANATVMTITWPMLRDTWQAKATLAEAAPVGHPLTVATSLAAFLGSPGQSGYAAANGYVEGLLAGREQSAAVALGPVADTAMAAVSGPGGPVWNRAGLEPLPGPVAVRALLGPSSRTLLAGDMSVLARLAEQQGYVVADRTGGDPEPWPDLLQGVPEEERERVVLAAVANRLSELLHASPDEIIPDRPLLALGVDSLVALELRSWLQTSFGVSLTVDSLFDEATARTVAEAVVEGYSGDSGYVLL